ncbi:hypothetical protein BT96DRAFT_443763 [Gymnopus androsaceus JB14]|uniref:Uncharacterized protein n=1 Tax=Gymnopus androsaceus JB14 TaxID=1447944 RepID=A0A6A4GS24_9AGAR|nr:hypothetical protein BT96DRAFT_443763 [Gymnopus androsaceus JB14]
MIGSKLPTRFSGCKVMVMGSGKSVLVSAIINHVKSLDAHENQLVAFYFFDFRDAFKQSFNNMVATLLSQLFLSTTITLQKDIYLAISQLYENHEKFRSKPSDRDLMRTLKENQGFKPFLQLVEELRTLGCSYLHLLIASRPHISYAHELEKLCSKTIYIDKEDINSDVEIFLDYTMQNDYSFCHHGLETKNQITDSLTRRANGMFRWVDCQLIALQSCIGLKEVDSVLNQLPTNLHDTYIQALQAIEPSCIDDTKQVLQWLCFSMEPLSLSALGEVIAFVSDDGVIRFEKRYRVAPEHIAFLGATLIHVDQTENVVELAHMSVKEFLLSEHLKSHVSTVVSQFHMQEFLIHKVIVESCLTYLLQFDTEIADTTAWNKEYPISRYAAQNWYKHAKIVRCEKVNQKASKLIESGGTTYVNCLKLAKFEEDTEGHWPMPQPLYYAAWCGLQDMVKQLVNGKNVDVTGGMWGSALCAALWGRNTQSEDNNSACRQAEDDSYFEIVKLLLSHGADQEISGKDKWKPLILAAYKGHLDITSLLIQNGANVNAQDEYGNTALRQASQEGHCEIVKLLLNHGAEKDIPGFKKYTPLIIAAENVIWMLFPS